MIRCHTLQMISFKSENNKYNYETHEEYDYELTTENYDN